MSFIVLTMGLNNGDKQMKLHTRDQARKQLVKLKISVVELSNKVVKLRRLMVLVGVQIILRKR